MQEFQVNKAEGSSGISGLTCLWLEFLSKLIYNWKRLMTYYRPESLGKLPELFDNFQSPPGDVPQPINRPSLESKALEWCPRNMPRGVSFNPAKCWLWKKEDYPLCSLSARSSVRKKGCEVEKYGILGHLPRWTQVQQIQTSRKKIVPFYLSDEK